MSDNFSHIIGHTSQKEFFDRVLSRGLTSHAYLFCGPAGVGKALFARAIAAHLLGIPIDQLHRHPDMYECTTKDNTIGVENVRELIAFARRSPAHGKALVLCIPHAEKLTAVAADALLKTIEDSTIAVHIFLTVVSADQLPDTVRSRTQIVPFFPVSLSELHAGFAGKAEEDMLLMSAGCPGRVVSWMADKELWEKDRQIRKVFAFMRGASLLEKREQFSSLFSGEDMTAPELISICESWHRFVDREVQSGMLSPYDATRVHEALLGVSVGLSEHIHPELLVDKVLCVV